MGAKKNLCGMIPEELHARAVACLLYTSWRPVGILLSHQTGCPSSEFSFGYRLNDSPCGADCGLGGIDRRHDIGSCGGIQAKGSGDAGDLAGGQHQTKAKERMVLEYHESGDENGGLQERCV